MKNPLQVSNLQRVKHKTYSWSMENLRILDLKEKSNLTSSKKLTFNKFHLTKNELSSAQTLKENYYIYRLQIIKGEKAEQRTILNLKVIKNPLALFKKDLIDIDLSSGEVALRKYEGEDIVVLQWSSE